MADQRDVQQLIQSLTPSGVNNGNPNTAYNNSGTPMMDAFGNWSMPQVNPAASIAFNRAVPSLPTTTPSPLTLPRLPSGTLGTTPVPGGGTTPVLGTPGTNLPEPPVQVGTGGNLPATPAPGRPAAGSGTGTAPIMDQLSRGGVSGVPSGSISTGMRDPLAGWSDGISLPEFFQGANSPLGYILEGLDKISELYLPGDMVQQGNLNLNQLLDSVAKQMGLPIEQAAQLIGKGDQYNAWLASGYGDLAGDLRFSDTSFGNTQGWGMGQINPITGQLSLGLLNNIAVPNAAVPTTFDQNAAMAAAFGPNWSSGGTVTGADGTTYANQAAYDAAVAAAQDAFAAMKLGSMGQKQTGADIYGNAYEK